VLPSDVLCGSDSFEMQWVHAKLVTTKVIYVIAARDRAHKEFI